jgi:hypothetical protein
VRKLRPNIVVAGDTFVVTEVSEVVILGKQGQAFTTRASVNDGVVGDRNRIGVGDALSLSP